MTYLTTSISGTILRDQDPETNSKNCYPFLMTGNLRWQNKTSAALLMDGWFCLLNPNQGLRPNVLDGLLYKAVHKQTLQTNGFTGGPLGPLPW